MAILRFIREAKDSSLLSLGIVEGEESARYTVSARIFLEIGSPTVGDVLDNSQMSAMEYADKLYRAEKKALSILSFADNNYRTLKQKLGRAGFDSEIAGEICDKMVSLGYINETRQLERLVLVEANTKLRGPGRIVPALVAKGYSLSDVKSVTMDLIERGEIDFKENAKKLLAKKLPDGQSEEKKKFLYKNGYKV